MTAIAVVGIGCRLPGYIDSPDALWGALLAGTDLVSEIPQQRWNADDYYEPVAGVAGRSVSRWGAFLDDPSGFDHRFFGIGEPEALAMDPQHRLLLEVTWEAAEHSGRDPRCLFGTDAGVFFGLSHQDYMQVTRDAGAMGQAYAFTGTPFSMASGRVAHAMGLTGPAITMDTACSSSLVAVHAARRSLLANECRVAFAGGVMLMFSPTTFASASGLGMLSPTGRCHAFDERADGFVRAEGCGVVMLKLLSDALCDGDRVLAVIRGSAVNQDGHTHNILAPSRAAQIAVIDRALAEAQVDPSSIGMIEAHGTGTPVGDTEEFHSLSTQYGRRSRCAVGSLKSNLGHAESAAGVLGLIKATLALAHGVVPRSLHFHRLPAHLQPIATRLFVPTDTVPWPSTGADGLRRAAVSSYGMSGTNAHVVLEQAPQAPASSCRPEVVRTQEQPWLFPISSTSPEALRATAARLAAWLDASAAGHRPGDVARTLARRRGHRPVRHALIARTLGDLTAQLRGVVADQSIDADWASHDSCGPVFVFSGQGSQWESMGAELLDIDPVFAGMVAAIEPLIQAIGDFSVTDTLRRPAQLEDIERVQPAIFTFQVALAASLKAQGVVPSAVIGHSMGEVSAAVAAGALSLEDGVRVICHRAMLCQTLAGSGAMAAVGMAPAAVREDLARRRIDDVEIAVLAAPASTVVGGTVKAVKGLVAAWQAEGLFAREVAVDVASHTSQVEPILAQLSERLAEVTAHKPRIPMYSTVLLDPRESPVCDGAYWIDNLRQSVRFRPAVQAALEDGHRVFVELSPHPIVTRAVLENAAATDFAVRALPSVTRGEPMSNGLLDLVGAIHVAGASIDFDVLYPDGQLLDLPLPAWTHYPLFLESATAAANLHHVPSTHPLLNVHRVLHEEPERHIWGCEVGLGAHPWLADHRVNGTPLFPGAGFCEMALAAARTALGTSFVEVQTITFDHALRLEPSTSIVCTAVLDRPGELNFRVANQAKSEARVLATARLSEATSAKSPVAYDVAALRAAHATPVAVDEVWRWFDALGIQYGPSFRALSTGLSLSADGASLLADLRLPSSRRTGDRDYTVHPVLLDACFQSVGAFARVVSETNGRLLLPLSVRSLRLHRTDANAAHCLTRLVAVDALHVEVDIDLLDASGRVLLSVDGLAMGSGAAEQHTDAVACNSRLLDIAWQLWDIPRATVRPEDGAWLLLDADDAGHRLTLDLEGNLRVQGFKSRILSSAGAGKGGAWRGQIEDALDQNRPCAVVVVLPRGNEPASPEVSRANISSLIHVTNALRQCERLPRLFVVTCMAQRVLPDDTVQLAHAGVRGWLRAVGAELPALHPTQIDVNPQPEVSLLLSQLLSGSDEDETAVRGASAYVARLQRSSLSHTDRRMVDRDATRDGIGLEIRVPGDLQSLELAAVERRAPAQGQVEVAVHAASVNFADVLVALGRYPSFDGRAQGLGLDFAGIVTAIGAGVAGFRVGDRVAGLCCGGAWGTYLTCDARLLVAIPRPLADAEAAAILATTATAMYGLEDLARIGPGDKVLIHSATGGVGQAAVAIARAAGAEIFATAGSEARRELLRADGISHVYDSRTAAFAEQILQDTAGYGVDVVLNSLTGASQRAGLGILAAGGRFIEIGKKDIYEGTWLELSPFRRNLSFFAVDLAQMCMTAPARVQALLSRVMRLAREERLPLPDIATYPLAGAADAIRIVSSAGHTGKLVLTVPTTGRFRVPAAPEGFTPFRRDGAYVVTGGLGGLGLFLADAMSAAGAGRLILNARSRPTDAAIGVLAAMKARRTEVQVISADIAEPATARRLIEAAAATGLPLRGVLHGAALVEDGILSSVTEERLHRNWAAKAEGAWHLHGATLKQQLDWFCCFSSVSALFGSPGQSAYAAANSWLDTFTQWRRAQGLPSSAIAWAAWADIGAGAHLSARGDTRMIEPRDGAYAFQALLRHDRGYAAYVHLDGAPWLTALAARSPFGAGVSQTAEAAGEPARRPRLELRRAPPGERPALLRRLIIERLGVILRRTVNPDRSLFDYGLDSLGTLQLLIALEADTGIRLRSVNVTTVRALADTLSGAMEELQPAGADARD
ncbi:sulfolipid-1 biosynthesis phthioceranic/hydroxyphthioceranic acid synthase [Bradyrhizobium amphicarpaeae]|uniref:sulfolipid-1 biosynthesis phthioceranic/hydroxyphthioceranic acid synthase n=1 Tax=Bradyrhizobium amphicarpaeae TaxID=1404768 RepID=UPI001FCF1A7F|nr:type I polyketide synthase [Bradyrhizobium amphicarpaeae]